MYADYKDHAVYEPERMLEHEMLHLAVVGTSPEGPGEEGPADLHLTGTSVVSMEPGCSDNAARLSVQCEQRTARCERFVEELPKYGRLIAVRRWMLLPDQRVRGYSEKCIKVLPPKGPEFEEVAFQAGLKVEGHYRVESSKPKKRSIRQPPSSCRSRKATYLPYSVMRAPRVPRQDCWKAPRDTMATLMDALMTVMLSLLGGAGAGREGQ